MPAPPALTDLLWIAAILPGFFILNEGAKLVTDMASVVARRTGRSKFAIGALRASSLGALPEVRLLPRVRGLEFLIR